MDAKTIFYVEDDEIIRANFSDLFSSSGYLVKVFDGFERAREGMLALDVCDIAVFDVELDGDRLAGIELCRLFRERHADVPIVLLSAHKQSHLQQLCFQMGADEYLSKDINLPLLLVRLSSIIRRYSTLLSRASANQGSLQQSALQLQASSRTVYCKDKRLNLNDAQYLILEALYSQPSVALSIDQLKSAAMLVVEPNTIVAHIRTIRKELNQCGCSGGAIETVRGKGYRWA
jgi:DNA-binding response OmpR family regulator